MNKKTLILAAVLAVLVILAYAYQGPIREWQAKASRPKNFLAKIDTGKIDKIIISKNGETTLTKQGADWLVEGPPAGEAGSKFKVAKEVMAEVMGKLDEAAKAELEFSSTNKDKKKDFKTDAGGVQVRLEVGGREAAKFVVGKVASDYQSSYLSQPEIDPTYLLGGVNLTYAFDREDWRDRTVLSGDPTKFSRVRFQFPNRQFEIAKTGEKWFTEGRPKVELDRSKMDKVLGLMANLIASGIPAQDFGPTGLEKNLMIIEATGEGAKNTLMVGLDNGEGDFYAKNGASDNIYLISKADRDSLDLKPEQLK